MAFKFVTFFAFVAVASAGLVTVPQVYHPAPVPTTVVKTITPVTYAHAQPILTQHHDDQYDPHPQYKFAYEVNDEHTGDNHSQQEERDGDVVHGEYSLIDADGFRRVVQYSVDPHSGFNAVVNRIPLEHVKTVVKSVAAPVHYVAPVPATTIVKQYPVPVAYHQHH
ncbi:larval cuticle protein A2B-like [Calliphora vicina]|uniref:larval cuticle protein A2B-like n=1 Tax=Calliphora vicina TaxID=7373 RepID=UPI00325B554C